MYCTVNSFLAALDKTIYTYEYDTNNIDIIRKLINDAIFGEKKCFTREEFARGYVLSHNIIAEMKEKTKTISDDIQEIIENYIMKYFKTKDVNIILNEIHSNSDLDKINKRIRHISTESLNDDECEKNIWDNLKNIFLGNDKNISKEEIRYDMIEAALNTSKKISGNAEILREPNSSSKDLTKKDAIRLVEKYVYANRIEYLFDWIDQNPRLSGQLLGNLIDAYFTKDSKTITLNDLDKMLSKIDIKNRANELMKLLNDDNSLLNISKEELISLLLRNSVAIYMYSKTKKSFDYDERKIYVADSNLDQETITQRLIKNNDLINNLIINPSIDYITDYINNLTDVDKYFLSNMYIVSRSLEKNKTILDNAIYHGDVNSLLTLGLLEDRKLIENLQKSSLTK